MTIPDDVVERARARVLTLVTARICRNCEYWDGGGEKAAKTAELGVCLNCASPAFTTEPNFTCSQFCPASEPEA